MIKIRLKKCKFISADIVIILPTSPLFDFQIVCSDSQYFSKHQIVLGSSSFIKVKQVKHRGLDISHADIKHELG